MKKFSIYFAIFSFLNILFKSNAQVSLYTFSQTNTTFVPITGGTVVATAINNTVAGSLDSHIYTISGFPFPFNFNGFNYTSCTLSTNGYITFGGQVPSLWNHNPISSNQTYEGAISAFGRDLNSVFNIAGRTGEIRWEVVGTAPNREIVFQWLNFRPDWSISTTDAYVFSFQIRLEETTNRIKIVYDQGSHIVGTQAASGTAEIGLRGYNNSDFNCRFSTTSDLFNNSTIGNANTSAQAFSTTASPPGMPNGGLMYIWTPSNCPLPQNVTLTSLSSTSASFSWNHPPVPPSMGYEWEVRQFGPPLTGPGLIMSGTTSGTAVNASPLGISTTYYFYIRSRCGSTTYSNWVMIPFTTYCPTTPIPINEGFNTSGTNVFPNCWSQQYVNGNSNITFQTNSSFPSTSPFEGTRYVFWNSYNYSNGQETRLVSLPLSSIGQPSVELEFMWFHDDSNYSGPSFADEGVFIEYSLDGLTWVTVGGPITRNNGPAPDGWTLKSVLLPPAVGNQSFFLVGFRFRSRYGHNCSLDAVTIKPGASCNPPTGITSSSITSNSATVSWSAAAPVPSLGYEYELRTSGAPGSGPSGLIASGTTTSLSVNFTGLTPSTTYSFYIRSLCSSSDQSAWTSAHVFSTQCAVIATFPFTETFDTTSPTLNCWTQIQEVGSEFWTFQAGSSGGSISSPYQGDQNARFVSLSPSNANSPITKLVSPVLDLSSLSTYPGSAVLSFWYGQESWFGDINHLKVYYRTSTASPWVQLAHYTTNVSSWTQQILFLPNLTSTYQIAFEGINNWGRANVVDFVQIYAGCSGATVTWNGSSWTPASPDNTRLAIINAPYNTSNHGSFSACAIEVNSSGSLTITDGQFVSAVNGVVNTGSITISSQGQLIQENNGGIAPTITLTKIKTGRRHNDVTFWSSPVQSITVGTALPDTEHYFKRRYIAQNGPAGGWVVANNSDTMVPGWGYMAREVRPGNGPHTATVVFTGQANNGIVSVPVNTSSSRPFNFLGNPYPSAIHCYDFYSVNNTLQPGSIGDEFFFWTSNTFASSPATYTAADYAKYKVGTNRTNGTGLAAITGGPIPNGSIATGQGFRILSNINGNFQFNNSMRVGASIANNQFYSELNRFWIDLTNSQGHFKQNAFVYLDESTRGEDPFGDAKLTSSLSGTNIYSFIGNDRYDIQYRGAFDVNDVISIGISTLENGVQQYTITLAKAEGLFAEDQPIYIHDKALGIYHNLKVSPYQFTAEGNEINDRFEITFQDGLLAIDDPVLSKDFEILLQNQTIIARSSVEMKTLKVYDFSGKLLAVYSPNASVFEANFQHPTGAYLVECHLTDGTTRSVKAFHP